jgi:hypothetical protein
MENFPKPKPAPKTAEMPPGQVTPAQEPNFDDERQRQIEKREGGAPSGTKRSDGGGDGGGSDDSQSPTPKIRNPDLAARLKALKETPPGQPSESNQNTEKPNCGLADQLGSSEQQQSPKTGTDGDEGGDNI